MYRPYLKRNQIGIILRLLTKLHTRNSNSKFKVKLTVDFLNFMKNYDINHRPKLIGFRTGYKIFSKFYVGKNIFF